MAPKTPPPPPPFASYRPSNERPPPNVGPRRLPPPPAGYAPRPAQRQKPRRAGGGLFSALFYTFLFVLIVAGAGFGYLLINPPSDLIRQQIAEQVKLRTGRDLVVAGPASFTFYPGLGVSLGQVSLSAPPGMTGNLVSMQALDIAVKSMPLLRRQIEVKSLVLHQPVFDLRISKSGARNWDFAHGGEATRLAQADTGQGKMIDAPPLAGPTGRALPARLSDVKDLQLRDVRIVDGTMRLSDERSGHVQEVKAVNVSLGLNSLQSPFLAHGNVAWRGERIDFDGKLTNARTVLEEKPAKLAFNASNRHFTATYDGSVFIKDGADLDGQLTANAQSARSLAAWLGNPLPEVSGFGPLSISGALKTNGNVTTFSNASFGLDGATANGTVSITSGGARPYVQASLRLSELDLNKYLKSGGQAPIAAETGGGGAPPAGAASPGEKPTGGDEIEKLLNSPGTKVYGAVQREGWSSETVNLALFGVADADAKLQLGRLLFHDLKIGQSALTVALKNRVMKTTFDDVRLYDGHGKGLLNVDATGKAAAIGANFGLEGIQAQPFLKDAAGVDWLAGKANVGLQLAATGASQLQLVESLNGKADLNFSDGSIAGFNVAGAVRGIQQGNLAGLKSSPSEKTDFSEMKATFNIANGVAQNQDLLLVSPLLRVSGAGAIHLPPRTLDYTLKPKLVASLEGQQGESALSGLEVPVRITGPWAKPKYEADLGGVLADPDKTVEAVKEIGKKFKGKNADEIVDELFGKKSGDGSQGSGQGSGSSAKELLNKFLKGN